MTAVESHRHEGRRKSSTGGLRAAALAKQTRRPVVLVVDDLALNREVLRLMLEDMDLTVETAASGEECLRRLASTSVDLVLLDMVMPVMDGLAAARAIRAMPTRKGRLPIIAITSSARLMDDGELQAAGFDGWIGKPIDAERLTETIQGQLRKPMRQNDAAACGPRIELRQALGEQGVRDFERTFMMQLAGCFNGDRSVTRREAHDLINPASVLGLDGLVQHCQALQDPLRSADDHAWHLNKARVLRAQLLRNFRETR